MTLLAIFSYAKSMDGISHTPQAPKHQASKFLVGTSVAILLLFLLLFLNYFNILSLSLLFPNQLGWLPHKTQQVPPLDKSQPTSLPNSNYSSNIFQYDTEKAKTILNSYVKDNIKPEFLPEKLDTKQGLSIDNRAEDIKYQFGSYLINNNETISINFHYKEGTNIPNDFMIFIQPAKVDKTTVTADLANSLTFSYFINPFPIESCNTKGATSYCEIFKIEADGKRGFGAIIAQDQSKSPSALTSIVFTCFIPKESKDYTTQKSCISP